MTFQEFIQHVENNIGTTRTTGQWTAQLTGITERRPQAIKVSILFTKADFSFTKEYKLVAEHFDTAAKFVNEVDRQLQRLNAFTNAVADYSVIPALPTINNTWKGQITKVVSHSPIHATVTFSFFRNFSNVPTFLTKDIEIYGETFMGKPFYADWVTTTLAALNAPIDISYYENLIRFNG